MDFDNVEELRDFVIRNISGPTDHNKAPTAWQFGYVSGGICYGWFWNRKDKLTQAGYDAGYKPIEDATEFELYKIIAECLYDDCITYKELYDEERKKKEPARDFTIAEVMMREKKYIVLKDTEGRMHGINYNGFKVTVDEPE